MVGFLVLNIVTIEVVGITLEFLVKSTIVQSPTSLVPIGLLFSEVIVVAVPTIPLMRVLRIHWLTPRLRVVLLVITPRCLVSFACFAIPFAFPRILFSIALFLILAVAFAFLPIRGFLMVLLVFEILLKFLPHLVHLVYLRNLDIHN